jgi:hypothetical protein
LYIDGDTQIAPAVQVSPLESKGLP